MVSDWVDVQIRSELDAGELLALLDDPFVPGAWQDDRTIHLYWPSQRWTSEHLARLRQTLRRLAERGVADPEIIVHSLADQDWNHQWARSVRPLRVGKRILIRPSWEPVEPTADQIETVSGTGE